jgi:hypothetical protein
LNYAKQVKGDEMFFGSQSFSKWAPTYTAVVLITVFLYAFFHSGQSEGVFRFLAALYGMLFYLLPIIPVVLVVCTGFLFSNRYQYQIFTFFLCLAYIPIASTFFFDGSCSWSQWRLNCMFESYRISFGKFEPLQMLLLAHLLGYFFSVVLHVLRKPQEP